MLHLFTQIGSGLGSLVMFIVLGWCVVASISKPMMEAARERRVAAAAQARTAEIASNRHALSVPPEDGSPRFPCGVTTGTFRKRGHKGAPPAGKMLWMRFKELAQGLLCVGPPGTGKTLLVIIPFIQWMASAADVGMFIPCVKREFADEVEAEIRKHRPHAVIHRVSPQTGGVQWNLMDTLAPDAVAGFVRTVGERKGGAADSTWSDAATSHAQSCSLLLWALTDGGKESFVVEQPTSGGMDAVSQEFPYDFISLHRIANVQGDAWSEVARHILASAQVLRARGDAASAERAEQIEIALEARALEFDCLGERTRSSVLLSINNVLGPLIRSVDLRHAFASGTDITLNDLDRGDVIILDIDMDKYRGAAEFLFMLAFEQFSGFALRRMTYANNMVAFIGDEFQQYASERAVDFFALSRQAKIVPCLAFQTVSRLIAKVGKKENAHAILSTFGSSLWFPTMDPETLQFVTQIVGSADVSIITTSRAEGTTSGDSRSSGFAPQSGSTGVSSGYSDTTTTSTALQQRAIVDAHLMRNLPYDFPKAGSGERAHAQVVGFVRAQGRIVDDVVTMWGPNNNP